MKFLKWQVAYCIVHWMRTGRKVRHTNEIPIVVCFSFFICCSDRSVKMPSHHFVCVYMSNRRQNSNHAEPKQCTFFWCDIISAFLYDYYLWVSIVTLSHLFSFFCAAVNMSICQFVWFVRLFFNFLRFELWFLFIYAILIGFYSRSHRDISRIRILVPGAGLGRMTYELAYRGYYCEGNEFSLFMLVASNFVLNRCVVENQYTIYPWVRKIAQPTPKA